MKFYKVLHQCCDNGIRNMLMSKSAYDFDSTEVLLHLTCLHNMWGDLHSCSSHTLPACNNLGMPGITALCADAIVLCLVHQVNSCCWTQRLLCVTLSAGKRVCSVWCEGNAVLLCLENAMCHVTV